MGQLRRKRPWLAALLGLIVTGFGHVYLRRWWRAAGWLLISIITTSLLVPQSAQQAVYTQLLNPGSATLTRELLTQLLPIIVVGTASVVDAYVIARMNNQLVRERRQGIQRCPACGRQIDPEVAFCQWCGTEQVGQAD